MFITMPLRFTAAFLFLFSGFAFAQPRPSGFNHLRWRMIGPHRGGRTVGAVGVPQQPNVFYIGVNNGGVWKTTDFGRTWVPIFDDQPTGSVGDVAVSPSNPNVLYVGSGEGLQRPDLSVGDGMYKSTDAGKTWTHLGLEGVQQIGGLAIDPTNENRLFVAALGHPYGPNKERGIYRTTDGGKSFENVFYIDENTGCVQVMLDPKNPEVVYADMWAGRQGPWENGAWNGPNSGLYKSTDGGNTWKKLTRGLPTTQEGLGRIGFAIAPSNPARLYATVDAAAASGIYRSDDGGESWSRIATDARLWGRGADFAELKVDPLNADVVYDANVVTWKSVDSGKTWSAFRGAPGGDDYHRIWINPLNPNILLLASDQGAIITVNCGETFSSWYNQPTAQFYHVITDNAFPYNVYGAQQESGSVGIVSRSNNGAITFRDWQPVGVEEYGYVAPDPLNPNIIYGGKITRHDKRTGQTQNIAPEAVRSGKYRFLRTAPVIFSPVNKTTLYFAGNVLFKTINGGQSWQVISPDLSRESWEVPDVVGIYKTESLKTMPRRGVIYTVAPSFKNGNTIWCGTDDGLIHLTRDGGKTWKNVTPPGITSWSKISLIEASHFDEKTAYAAVNRIRLDDLRPHIYKTTDGGKTWKEIVAGLPSDPINVVREDPRKKDLLFAGSERAVSVSFDGGEHWQSLRLNMPATSIRDLVIKDEDIVVGTHGRSFWILDNIQPLRYAGFVAEARVAALTSPETVYRVHWNLNTDTPLPQEEPAGENPPDGAALDYVLKADAKDEVAVEIRDAANKLLRRFSSKDTLYKLPPVNIPLYWVRPQQSLATKTGSYRFVWDLRYPPLNLPPSFPIAAIYGNTAPQPTSPWVMPGTYTAALYVDGKVHAATKFTVKMDRRIKTAPKDLQRQHDLSATVYQALKTVMDLGQEVEQAKLKLAGADVKGEGAKGFNDVLNGNGQVMGLNQLQASLISLLNTLQESDAAPTQQAISGVQTLKNSLQRLTQQWHLLQKQR